LPSVHCADTRYRSSLWSPLPVPLPSVLGSIRQRLPLCRVPAGLALGKGITSGPLCQFLCRVHYETLGNANVAFLPSAKATSLGKKALLVPRCAFFVECYDLDTRQRTSLPSVTLDKVTRIPPFYLFLLFLLNKQKIYHIYITDIT
jgi:hypothetical protein